MAKTYSAGIATAYGAAKRGGYAGTYEDFCREQAGFAENARQVAEDREAMEALAGQFETSTVPQAIAAIQQEGAAQAQNVSAAGAAQVGRVQEEGTAQVGRVQLAVTEQMDRAELAANSALTSERNAADSASAASESETNAEVARTAAAQSADQAQSSAATAAGSAATATAKAGEAADSASAAANSADNAEADKDAAEAAQEAAETAAQSVSESAAQIAANAEDIASLQADQYKAFATDTASGPIAAFPDGADGIPVKDLVVGIEPVQSGSGEPSPSNNRPISGWSGANVTRIGKNASRMTNGMIKSSDGLITLTSSYASSEEYIKIKGGLRVTVSGVPASIEEDGSHGFAFYDEKKNFIKFTTVQKGTESMTSAVEGGASYLRFRVFFGNQEARDAGKSSIMAAYGTDAVPLEPYAGEIFSITFPSEAGTVYGGTLDVTTGVLMVDRAIFTLDGTSKKFGYKFPDKEVYQHTLSEPAKAAVSGTFLSKTLCDRLPTQPDNTVQAASADAISTSVPGTAVKVCLISENLGSLASANDWLTSNPLQVCYELASPAVYNLTPAEVKTLLGANSIWANCGDSTVEYRADTKLYIDKKIAALAAAMN